MQRLKPILGYTAAALTIMAAVLTPFVLIGLFTRGVAATGVRVFFHHHDTQPVYGKMCCGGDSTDPGTDDNNRFCFHSLAKGCETTGSGTVTGRRELNMDESASQPIRSPVPTLSRSLY